MRPAAGASSFASYRLRYPRLNSALAVVFINKNAFYYFGEFSEIFFELINELKVSCE